nr:MAG TPA: fibrinogen-binding protein [Caudoviricetes sp.]
MSKSDRGFTIKMDRLDHMIYINYKTKLVNAVKDSVNPTNKIELKAETDGATSYSYVQLVGGKGDASGENKPEPTFEIPREAPKVDIPEFQGGIPGIPEVRELPEYTEPIGTVPNEAPILDLPELHIPEEPTPEKPSTPEKAPKTSVERANGKVAQSTTVSYNFAPASKETPKTTVYGGTLPNTGEKEGIMSTLGLVVIAAGITGLTLGFKKYSEEEND